MHELIYNIVLNSLFILGVNVLFSEGHLLFDFGTFVQRFAPKSLLKPIFLCVQCMSSVWGLIYFVVAKKLKICSIVWAALPVYTICLLGFMTFFIYLISFLNK